jgi:hypothetical protein
VIFNPPLCFISVALQDRFVRQIRASRLPSRDSSDYNKAIRERHGAILGVCALVDSYPYTVEKWMPDLLANVLAEHTYDPVNVHICRTFSFLTPLFADPNIYDCQEVREQLQEDASGYLA